MKEKLVQAKPPGPSDGVYLPQTTEVIGNAAGVTLVRLLVGGPANKIGGDGPALSANGKIELITGS